MAKRKNRLDFDDFDDYTPVGSSYPGSAGTNEKENDTEDEDWAGNSRRRRKRPLRSGAGFPRTPWLVAVSLVIAVLVVSLAVFPGREDRRPEMHNSQEPTSSQLISVPTEYNQPELTLPPMTEPSVPPTTQPQIPVATEPHIPETTQPQFPEVTEPQIPEVTEPQATGVQLLLEQEAQILEDKYGITILVGEQCDTVYGDYTASIIQDYNEVMSELNMLDQALSRYPEGFFRQLCNSYWKSIRIYLIADLWANGETVKGDGYAAIGGSESDYFLMVLDIYDTYEELYYHEIMHMIDNYLAWDARQREGALFSEEGWMNLNPDWFAGYSNDYSNMPTLPEEGWFVDSYGAINSLEDRAQIMSKGMMDGNADYIARSPGIRMKLDYLSRCIRDTFDTTGWPEILPWEQYLYG